MPESEGREQRDSSRTDSRTLKESLNELAESSDDLIDSLQFSESGPEDTPSADEELSGVPDIGAGENIEALTDRLIDALVTGDPTPSQETASAESPECPRIVVDGDHGEDIDDCLQTLFGDGPSPATPRTPRADLVAETGKTPARDPAVAAAQAKEIEEVTIVDVFGTQPPAPPMENVKAASPTPPTHKQAVPAAGQIAAMAQERAIPWSQTAAKARRENPYGSRVNVKWLAAALLVGGMASLAWLVVSPGSGPIEKTTVTSAVSTPRRTSPPPTPPVEKLAALVEPGPELPGEASGRPTPVEPSIPDTTTAAPIKSAETPKKTARVTPVAQAKPAKPAAKKSSRVKPPPPKTASALLSESQPKAAKTKPPVTPKAQAKTTTKPTPTSKPRVATAATKSTPTPKPRATAAATKPTPTPKPPVRTASNDPVTVKPPTAKAIKPTASTPAPVAKPTQPVLISREAPTYRKRDGPGVVVLQVLVSETGRVSRVVIKKGIPGSPLEASAIDAALRSTYRPATENGQAVRVWTVERFEFE